MSWLEIAATVLCSIIASSGFWAFLQHQHDKNDASAKLVLGLAHDRIMSLGMEYIERGWITKDEYENMHDYLYLPYKNYGGNGSGDRVMAEVERLPIRSIHVDTERRKYEVE